MWIPEESWLAMDEGHQAMEAEDDERVNNNVSFEMSAMEGWSGGVEGGGGGDEGGGDPLFVITKLQQHATSDVIFSRQMVGRILVDIFRAAVNNGTKLIVDDVMQPVQQILSDPEAQVRCDFVEQLPHIAMICQQAPQLFGDVLHAHLLGIIIKYIPDTDSQVRQTAQTALLTLIKQGLLDNTTIEAKVCPVVEYLSYMPVEFLNSAISLMSKMAPLIGKELTEKVFLDRYIALCEHDMFFVRKTCAAHFGEICASVGRKALFRRLLPTFVDLCCDTSWAVRKACVDVMMSVSCCLTLQNRRMLLAEILATHLNDDSKWVRISAFEILGPFISTFAVQFSEITYNQQGESVFSTNPQDDHCSIRLSSDGGAFPTKTAIHSHTFDPDDYNSRANINSHMLMQKLAANEDDVSWHLKEEDVEADKNRISFMKAYKSKVHRRKHLEDAEDVEKYNPFLYYYIPPALPVDDLDRGLLTDARISAQRRYALEMRTIIEQSKNIAGPQSNLLHSAPMNENEQQLSIKRFEFSLTMEGVADESSEDPVDGSSEDLADETSKDPADGFFFTSPAMSELLDVTVDVSDISLDKSIVSTNIVNRKQELKETGQIVPQALVDYFVSMAEPEQGVDMGAEIPHHCAFSFPAVALTLGRENWPYLKKAYQSLAGAKQWKVRRTLASSIHEIASILGEELTATDLVPIYDGFMRDLDEVRIGILKHLATFLKILKPVDRCQYLPRLTDFLVTDNEWNWRFREELATQLLDAVPLFSPHDVAKHIAALSVQLLIDKVAAVRHVALSLVTQIISHLSTEDPLLTSLLCDLRQMLPINPCNWIYRQTYALLCAKLISSIAITPEKFSIELLPNLLNLSLDRVPNVRLAVARTLSQHVTTMGLESLGAKQAEDLDRRLKELRMDPDRDVRVLAGGEVNPLLDILSQNKTEQTRNILF